jgi:hypothetical protein
MLYLLSVQQILKKNYAELIQIRQKVRNAEVDIYLILEAEPIFTKLPLARRVILKKSCNE